MRYPSELRGGTRAGPDDGKVRGDIIHGGSGIGNLGGKVCENGGITTSTRVGFIFISEGETQHGTMEFIFRLNDCLEGVETVGFAGESNIEDGKREETLDD